MAKFAINASGAMLLPSLVQVAEAVAIQNCKADTLLNSKSEWEQPAVERLIVTRELPDQDNRRGGGGLRGRGRPQRGAHH